MTLSAPTRFNSLRGFRHANFTNREPVQPTVSAGTVIPLRPTRAAHAQHILVVEFSSPDGRAWQAIGGGDTLADAVSFAHDSCPTDTTWQPSSWTDLYGD